MSVRSPAAQTVHLSHRERSERIARCVPGEGLRSLVGPAALTRAFGRTGIRLYTHVTMVENQALYERIGYVETGRTTEHGFTRVFYEKRL